MTARILVGDCRERLTELPPASIDAIVCDPPYGLEFMGKDWDRPWAVSAKNGVGYAGRDDLTLPSHRDNRNANCRACGGRARGVKRCVCESPQWDRDPASDMKQFQIWTESWAGEAYRVLKPGGHMLVFGGTRTYHRMAVGVEDAGFEIRDCIVWLYGSGFPKSRNLDGEWDGWGTALKPAMEPIIVARKPLRGTVAANVAAHGTGAINIDGCRIDGTPWTFEHGPKTGRSAGIKGRPVERVGVAESHPAGRWPANVVLDEDAAAMLDAQTGATVSRIGKPRGSAEPGNGWGMTKTGAEYDDSGGASRFFYCAKADRAERNNGLASLPSQRVDDGRQTPIDNPFLRGETERRNSHPTVKPIALMQWLVRLVTPPGGVVLDPFMGSGTTGIACGREGFDFIGCELSEEYVEIAERRIRGDAPMFADVTIDRAPAPASRCTAEGQVA